MTRNRIVEVRTVKGADLIPNPANWRRHPEAQRDAMAAVLDDVGNIDVLKAVETPDGLLLIDGHLRADLMPEEQIQVAVLDLDETEQAKILATFDPIGAMAETDKALYESLVDLAETDNATMQALMAAVLGSEAVPDFEANEEPPGLDQTAKVTCPNCGHDFKA